MNGTILAVAAVVAGLAVASALLAWILRAAGAPGGRSMAALAAGASVGLLAGPGVLGAGWPELHERLVLGGAPESRRLHEARSRHAEEAAVMRAAGVSGTAVDELRAAHRRAEAPLAADLARARGERRAAFDWAAHGLLAAHLFLFGLSLAPAGRRSAVRLGRAAAAIGGRCAAVGAGSAAVACAVPAVAAWIIAGLAPAHALALGVALGAPGVVPGLRSGVFIACAAGSALCAAVALLLAWSPMMTLALMGLPLGVMASLGAPDGAALRRARRQGRALAMGLTLPALGAMLALHPDLRALASGAAGGGAWVFWTGVVAAVLWSPDGRWLCWWALWKRLGPAEAARAPWTCATHCVNAGVGPAQAGFALMLAPGAGEAGATIAAAALLAALIVELTRQARLWLAPRLDAL